MSATEKSTPFAVLPVILVKELTMRNLEMQLTKPPDLCHTPSQLRPTIREYHMGI